MSPSRGLSAVVWCIAAVGCGGSDVARGRVDVVAYSELTGAPYAGALVLFADRDGQSREAYVDDAGHAGGDVEPGGSVWLVELDPSGTGANQLTAYTDVQPGATLRFGPDAPRATTATMPLSATPPPGGGPYPVVARVHSACSPLRGSSPARFDDRCAATTDVLVVAYQLDPVVVEYPYAYAYYPAMPITDGGTLTVATADWRPLDQVTLQLQGDGGAIGVPNTRVAVMNQFGVHGRTMLSGKTATTQLPLVGGLYVEVDLLRAPGQAHTFGAVHLPATASQTVDLANVLAPWVLRDPGSPTWTADDVGGALRAQAMVIEHYWVQPIANYEVMNTARIISAPVAPGTIAVPRLPDGLADQQPGADFQIDSAARPVRVEGGTDVDPFRVAERAYPRGPFRDPASIPATSVSISIQY
ncbi:MAG TPA: hypothetical protein VNO30_24625 [Kofleriaceae bacterium]|nr:hypothetical protein [Kofleriaceae bacterium]